jgi:hypothetical protein
LTDLTDFHAKYFTHELTRRHPSDSAENLAGAIASAQVDLNPHQVDAALSPSVLPYPKARYWRMKSVLVKQLQRVFIFVRQK